MWSRWSYLPFFLDRIRNHLGAIWPTVKCMQIHLCSSKSTFTYFIKCIRNLIESNRETSIYFRGCQKAIFPWSYAAIKSVLVHDCFVAEQVFSTAWHALQMHHVTTPVCHNNWKLQVMQNIPKPSFYQVHSSICSVPVTESMLGF